eukprot:6567948-Pyramimonas_sp.AAC.1
MAQQALQARYNLRCVYRRMNNAEQNYSLLQPCGDELSAGRASARTLVAFAGVGKFGANVVWRS